MTINSVSLKSSSTITAIIFLLSISCSDDQQSEKQAQPCRLSGYVIDEYRVSINYDASGRIQEMSSAEKSDYTIIRKVDYGRLTSESKIIVQVNFPDDHSFTGEAIMAGDKPVKYFLTSGDISEFEYSNSSKISRILYSGSFYQFTFDGAGRNITKIERFLKQGNVKTGVWKIEYDNKPNPYKGFWLLSNAYADHYHLYFCENNPIRYTYTSVESPNESWDEVISYEYNSNGLPERFSVNRLEAGQHQISTGSIIYKCR